ncbi:MAG: GNAT family N-acetyltransferase [Actinomycetota bacterium]|nr:GNAT family N-acetyltransferase [Actinomycetota bacterium]
MDSDRSDATDRGLDVDIADNPAASRYELRHNGVVGVVEYRLDDGVLVIPHVEVVPALRGRGHSESFLDAVLEAIEARDLKVRPLCGYARAHFHNHPERATLLAP